MPDLTYIAESLRPLAVPLAGLTADPANARRHPERNLDAIRASLSRFGQRKPLVVQRQGMVVRAGNGTLEAARALGWTHLAAVVVDEPDVSATAYAIADNRSAELAEWDEDVLGALLNGLPDDLRDDAGYTRDELDELLALPADELSTAPALGGATYQIVVDCDGEASQAELLSEFEERGLKCRALIL